MSEPTNNSSVELNTPKTGPCAPIKGPDALSAAERNEKHKPGRNAVSYTHLTLPTIYSV